jgi:hypothetical protein
MTLALRAMGKTVRAVSRDKPPGADAGLPWRVRELKSPIGSTIRATAVIVMECGDLKRTGIDGLERGFVINIDHHPGNTNYGAMNWFDISAAACGEMVFDIIRALGVPLTTDIATTSTSRFSPTRARSIIRTSRRARSISAGTASRPASVRPPWPEASSTATTWPAEAVRRRAQPDAAR